MSADVSARLWQPLTLLERRILGVLVEKQKTSKSSDTYPLSLNALTTGCNQKSNREPVLDLDEVEVEEGLSALQKQGLVMRLTGGRVDRFKHELYEKWTPHGAQMAVLAELLLRGPQTKGELRIRASRMDPIDSLDALEDVLKPLVERGLVVYITDPNRRGAVLSHGFHAAEDLERLKTQHAAGMVLEEVAAPPPAASSASPAEFAQLKSRVESLEIQMLELRKQLGHVT